jgi:D-alanine-D-alanine ligase-like ATP-grasp enzyme
MDELQKKEKLATLRDFLINVTESKKITELSNRIKDHYMGLDGVEQSLSQVFNGKYLISPKIFKAICGVIDDGKWKEFYAHIANLYGDNFEDFIQMANTVMLEEFIHQ